MVEGVMNVYTDEPSMLADQPLNDWPKVDRDTFIDDQMFIKHLIHNGSL